MRIILRFTSISTKKINKMVKIQVGTYLIKRLKQLGVRHVFGLPGDFNLGLLDFVEDEEGIDWVGGCNELNSGYAADGYARINKIGVCFLFLFKCYCARIDHQL